MRRRSPDLLSSVPFPSANRVCAWVKVAIWSGRVDGIASQLVEEADREEADDGM